MSKQVTKKTAADKPKKPYPGFPLTPHPTGRWCKKVRGRLHYFGSLDDPQAALAEWNRQAPDLMEGRLPRPADDTEGVTVRMAVSKFLTSKLDLVNTREITQRHFDDLYCTCEIVVCEFGGDRRVDDLRPDDFAGIRRKLAKTRGDWASKNCGAWALGSQVTRIRSLFKHTYEAGSIDRPMGFGTDFKRPTKNAFRREREQKPAKMFEPKELRRMIKTAGTQLRAMIYLGLNCGFGNSELGKPPLNAVNLETGWVEFPRPKTGVAHRCNLWPETKRALKAAIAERSEPKDPQHAGLLFVTKYGTSWSKERAVSPDKRGVANPLSAEF